jgi:subtilisin family serine protease
MGRQSFGAERGKSLNLFSKLALRKRKSWTFERLEDRLVFSVTPPIIQTVSFSNSTPEGQAMTYLHEMQWSSFQQAALDATSTEFNSGDYTYSLPNDPLFPYQWHLLNTGQEVGNPDFQALYGVAGQDINVVPVWNDGYTGEGVTVAVIDTGVQITHPDLVGNIDPTRRYNAITGTANVSPDLFDGGSAHGTSVAGLIGASWNNLGDPILDEDGEPVLDDNGNVVYSGGGTGVAPNVSIVPIKLIANGFSDQAIINAFQYALQNGIDITNNSWGPGQPSFNRVAAPYALSTNDPFLNEQIVSLLRDSVLFGRNGLGMINVFASGNSGGPIFSPGFPVFNQAYDSSSYDPYVNSRYTIAVTGVDHDGQYMNSDGSFTSYPEAGAAVLVAAPTGSNVFQNVADDSGQGSGIWTTDLVGDFGFNAAALPNGFDPDRDFLPDPDYTSRFNGTSAAAPIVSGVIALMLEANPNLTYRDVQEILVRSARQNAEFETATSGALSAEKSTWQTNQIGPFRDPDPFIANSNQNVNQAVYNPLTDPSIEGFFFGGDEYAPDAGDGGRQFASHYESQPGLFTNGAGYTVSQGYGVYSEQIGYAHGVIDAELAVTMAKQWHTTGQNLEPFTERTYTSFVTQPGANLPAAERGNRDSGFILVPGGLYGLGGFIDYWNEYFADDDPADPEDGPFSDDDPPVNSRGFSYIDFAVPPNEAIDVEWVEVKVDISGPSEDLDFIRIMLTSPDGTQSELNHFYGDPDFATPLSFQSVSAPIARIDAPNGAFGGLDPDGGTFVWTYSTNRNWGESTNTAVIIDPVTGEPVLNKDFFSGTPISPAFRNWELHIENWSNSDFGVQGIEVVWHGKPIAGGTLDQNWDVAAAQRIQGFVGIDSNGDGDFNYQRSIQTVGDSDNDPATIRAIDVQRQLDFVDVNNNGVYEPGLGDVINQEKFAENILVQAYVVDPVTDQAAASPVAQFLTGADGNYYFDLDPTKTYEIRVVDPESRPTLEDQDTPSQYLQHYKQVWRITPDWFYAPDRDNPLTPSNSPGEIFFGSADANGDGIATAAPLPFLDVGAPIPMAVKNVNFLLKQDAVPEQFDVTGTVYADLNGNGVFDGDDVPAANVVVYQDVNRNGVADSGEQRVTTDANGQYRLTIPAAIESTYQVGVIPPTPQWLPTDAGHDGVETVFAGPGSADQVVNFFLDPPDDAFPDNGVGNGTLQGVIFNDLDGDGVKDGGEIGVAGFRIFIDANENGVWDSATEQSVVSGENGAYFFADVEPGVVRLDIVVPDEGTPAASWSLTTPAEGFLFVTLGEGGNISGLNFGLDNRADDDWGDLPDSYQTTSAAGGPHHHVVPGFRLGASIDGEVDGVPTAAANGEGLSGDNDDGVKILSNGGVLRTGANTLQVTVAGVGGLLTGWMDFNNDGHFDESERLSWTLNGNGLGGEADLNPGTYSLQITVPAGAVDGAIAARFRWGEQGLSFAGPATIGEVEDYRYGLNFLFGDYNRNGTVDQADYNVWRRTTGQTVAPYAGADGDGNGIVNDADLDVWRANFGSTLAGPGAGAGSSALLADNSSSSGAFAPVVVSVGEGVGFGSRNSYRPPLTAASSNSNLLLVDLALADSSDGAYSNVEDVLIGEQQDESNANDLAFAAVASDSASWWDSI